MRSKAGRERRETLQEEEEETEGYLRKVKEEEGVGKEALEEEVTA